MAKFTAPIPKDKIEESFVWRDWFQRLSDKVFGTVSTQDAHNVEITGGAISNTNITGGSITKLTTPLSIDSGGTGHVTANSAINALLPSQTGNANKYLKTDGTNTSWGASAGTVTSVSGTGTVSGITLTGTVTTSGNLTLGGTLSAAASSITSGTIDTARLGSGTASSTTYLRGDQTWASVTATTAVNLSGGTLTTSSYTLVSSNNLIALQSSAGNGVFVNGSGASFTGSSDNAISLGTSGYRWSSLYVAGTFGWGGYSIAAPSGGITTFLRNDGTWASISSSNVTNALGYTPYSNTNPSGYITSSGSCSYATSSGSASTAANLSGGVLTTSSYTLSSSSSLVALGNSSGYGVFVNGSSAFAPSVDNTLNCGSSGFRWSTVYATTGTINTSDKNQKQQIENLTNVELAVATELKSKIKTFKFNDAVATKGSAARKHIGWIAQDVQDTFSNHGLNASDYGMFCSDEVNGQIVLGVRYEELLTFISAAEDQRLEALINEVNSLKTKIT